MVTCPQLVHSNLCTAKSRLLGCDATAERLIGLRHFGHVSFMKRSKDMVGPFRTPPSRTMRYPPPVVCIKAHTLARDWHHLVVFHDQSLAAASGSRICAEYFAGIPAFIVPPQTRKREPFCLASRGNNAYCIK